MLLMELTVELLDHLIDITPNLLVCLPRNIKEAIDPSLLCISNSKGLFSQTDFDSIDSLIAQVQRPRRIVHVIVETFFDESVDFDITFWV